MLCRVLTGLFGLLYLGALALLAIGTFGLFGAERDPLAGVFLVPLGLPWNLIPLSEAGGVLLLVGLGAPLINLGILVLICRVVRGRR